MGSGGFWGKGLATEARINWASCRCVIRILFWRRWPKSWDLPAFSSTLLLYTALLLRLIQNAQRAKDRAGMFLVMGVAAILGFHVLVNVAMVIGYHAGDRYTAAADELRRFGHVVRVFGAGPGDERPFAAIRQLSPRALTTPHWR